MAVKDFKDLLPDLEANSSQDVYAGHTDIPYTKEKAT